MIRAAVSLNNIQYKKNYRHEHHTVTINHLHVCMYVCVHIYTYINWEVYTHIYVSEAFSLHNKTMF